MKLPLTWLRDWVEVDVTPEQVADALTHRGFYVEGIETHGVSIPGVVVARVLEVTRHPNADRLTLCRVDGGQGEVRVVCGAPNVRAGMLAPLATVGATLPGGMTIKKSKIRGEPSEGMLCSASELGISDDHGGIVDLEALLSASGDATTPPPVGAPIDQVLGPPVAVLEVEVPFNRPDGLGIVGLAREVMAAGDGRWTDAARGRLAAGTRPSGAFDLVVEDREGCPRYLAQVVEAVTVGPSPRWLVQRVESVGQRSINNVVDLTNLVLFEFGQPLHAFDLARLGGPSIRVRRARAGERMVTLDGKDRALDPEVLVIADRDRPVALAGIMGGAESEVTAATHSLLLECAWFDPRRVRRGARWLALSTEASKRYERGVDPEIGPAAAARFLDLLGQVVPGIRLGAGHDARTGPAAPRTVPLRTSRIARLLGAKVDAAEATRHLERMEYRVDSGNPLSVTIPSWRPDVTLEDDLVEEVARARGYATIPEAPLDTRGLYAIRSSGERMVARARAAMIGRGLTEAWTSSMVSEREAIETAALLDEGPPQLVRLLNPMSREGEVMRPNPVAGLLRACAHNLRQGAQAVRMFEIGTGFAARVGDLPLERRMLAAIVSGPGYAHAHSDREVAAADRSLHPVDFLAAKGLWEAWFEEMRVDTPNWRAYAAAGWKLAASAEVASGASRIGWAGLLSQQLLRTWDIEVPVHLFVALLDALPGDSDRPHVTLPGRFPPVRRDLAFFVPEAVRHAELASALRRAGGESLLSLELFDVYAGAGTPAGMKSLAFALQYQHPERTLAEDEIQRLQERITTAAARECGAQLRER